MVIMAKRSSKNKIISFLIILVIVLGGVAAINWVWLLKSVELLKAERAANVIPELAPIPKTAFGPAIPEKGYLVEEIDDGLYWVTEGVYQVMFLTTGEGVIVVDAPPTIGENILKAIEEVTDEPITHVIYSHSHADHIAAASMYPEDAKYISTC